MSKIVDETMQAFFCGEAFNKASTRITTSKGVTKLYYYEEAIAIRSLDGAIVNLEYCHIRSTLERVNAVIDYVGKGKIKTVKGCLVWFQEDGTKIDCSTTTLLLVKG